MLNQSDKIERFTEVINKTAEKQCKKIKKQTEAFKEKELKELEFESENELKSRIDFEIGRIATETNKRISLLQSESKKEIAKVRDEITKNVFEKVRESLADFVKTEQYKVLLEKSFAGLCEETGNGTILYVRKEDEETANEYAKTNPAVSAVSVTDEISIGGAFASNKEKTVFAYDTLESRLEGLREAFMASSGLTIV